MSDSNEVITAPRLEKRTRRRIVAEKKRLWSKPITCHTSRRVAGSPTMVFKRDSCRLCTRSWPRMAKRTQLLASPRIPATENSNG